MDGIQFSSNDKENSIDMYGKNEISYGFNTSDILPGLSFCYVLHCYTLINLKFETKFKL